MTIITQDKTEKKKEELKKKLADLKESLILKKDIHVTEKGIRLIESRESERKRKADTRKKILVGSYYVEKMKTDQQLNENTLKILDKYLTKNTDRALFKLPDLPPKPLPDFARGNGIKPWDKKIHNGNEIFVDNSKKILTPEQIKELKPFVEKEKKTGKEKK